MAVHIGNLIIEKEKAATEVLDTRNYLTKIISGSLDGIVVSDGVGKIEFVNEAFVGITESEENELIGLDMCSLFKEKSEELKSFLRNTEISDTFVHELSFITRDGTLKYVILSMGSVKYRNELKYVSVAKDITEIKKLEQMKSNIIANISHELRTPLNIMKGFVEISIDEHNNDKRRLYLQKSLQALEKQSWMIQDLLEVARGDNETGEFNMVKTNINGVVEMACREIKGKLDASGINVTIKLGTDRFVKAEPEKLAYALTKIIDNALKFTDKGGDIEIGTLLDDDGAVIYTKDTGTGIPKENLAKVFEKFYQVDGTSTRKFGGNGLGLAIAKTIIEKHEGKLWVESELGEGSTFYLSVPYFVGI
jgi:two-component system sensor histidine kinase VicK